VSAEQSAVAPRSFNDWQRVGVV